MLIFETGLCDYVAKVADFGYSTQYVEASDLINMPKSEPWHAPEWHHRGFTPAQAMKMDAYSFGLLVLWVLHYSSKKDSYLRLKSDMDQVSDDILPLASNLANVVSPRFKDNLLHFYEKTLTRDVESRCSNFEYLRDILAGEK